MMLDRRRLFRFGLIVSTALTPVLTAGSAFAQAAAVPAPPQQAAEAYDKIETITVTAQKRSELLTKVPISVTALDQETLDKQGAKDMADVARLVPGLSLQTTDSQGDTNISIRGITSDTGAQTTGVYIDDTPVQARQEVVAANPYPKVFDLDHIEVLKGPQGTLFGAGSEGGTVRFLTPEPSLSTYSGFVRSDLAFTDGGAPSYEAGGAVGGPIVDGVLGFRASIWDREDGGYINRINPVTNGTTATDANAENSRVGHFALRYTPTDNLILETTLYFQEVHENDRSFYWESVGPYNELSQIPQPSTDTFVLPTVSAEYDFDGFSVKTITSYFKRNLNQTFDATSFDLSGVIPLGNNSFGGITLPGDPNYLTVGTHQATQSNWTEELRFTSDEDSKSRWSWIAGLYYQHNRSSDKEQFAEPFDEVGNYLSEYYYGVPGDALSYFGEAPLDGKFSYIDRFVVNETDKAIFGNVSYAILDNLKATVGLRVAQSGFDFNEEQDGPYGPAMPTTASGSQKETPVTPRFNLAYQLTPDQMIYATAAKGYRIGGANEAVPADICATDLKSLGISQVPGTYNSDTVWNYELGAKGKFFDDRLLLEGSLYWINWNGIQQQVYLPSCGYFYTANLGTATSRGFDLDAQWAAGGGLVLSGSAGLTDARYTSTVTENGNILSKSGDSLAAPEWSATAAAQYNFKVMESVGAYARVDYQFSGSYYRTGSAETFSYDQATRNAPTTHYVTMRFGANRDGWDVSAYINNVLDSRTSLYRYQDTSVSPGLRDLTFRPVTVGVTAAYKF
jgi:iron complex outermembrane recepter protein